MDSGDVELCLSELSVGAFPCLKISFLLLVKSPLVAGVCFSLLEIDGPGHGFGFPRRVSVTSTCGKLFQEGLPSLGNLQDTFERHHVCWVHERVGDARPVGPTCPSNAVHVVVDILGTVKFTTTSVSGTSMPRLLTSVLTNTRTSPCLNWFMAAKRVCWALLEWFLRRGR